MDAVSDTVSEDLSSPEPSYRSTESYQSNPTLKFSIQNILKPDFGKVRIFLQFQKYLDFLEFAFSAKVSI